MTKTATVATRPTSKRTAKKARAVLSTCPMNGAGWCPYPFSPAQLEKRLKQKAEQEAEQQQSKQIKQAK